MFSYLTISHLLLWTHSLLFLSLNHGLLTASMRPLSLTIIKKRWLCWSNWGSILPASSSSSRWDLHLYFFLSSMSFLSSCLQICCPLRCMYYVIFFLWPCQIKTISHCTFYTSYSKCMKDFHWPEAERMLLGIDWVHSCSWWYSYQNRVDMALRNSRRSRKWHGPPKSWRTSQKYGFRRRFWSSICLFSILPVSPMRRSTYVLCNEIGANRPVFRQDGQSSVLDQVVLVQVTEANFLCMIGGPMTGRLFQIKFDSAHTFLNKHSPSGF